MNSTLTDRRRNEIIENGGYINEKKYNNRYRMDDIRKRLEKTCHFKCAYCEKNIRDTYAHIEHYRPKSMYYWLAYSWDNLLLCCDKCNVSKKDSFEVEGTAVQFDPKDISDIHGLSKRYNEIEKPKMIHPEMEDVEDRLVFTEKGSVSSKDSRTRYTISTCRLDRKSANERRKTLYDDFMKKYRARVLEYKIREDPVTKGKIIGLIENFKNDAHDPEKEFLAFRRWIIKKMFSGMNSS